MRYKEWLVASHFHPGRVFLNGYKACKGARGGLARLRETLCSGRNVTLCTNIFILTIALIHILFGFTNVCLLSTFPSPVRKKPLASWIGTHSRCHSRARCPTSRPPRLPR